MATSYAFYKKEVTDYLKSIFGKDATILDVGAGEGTYLPFLQDYFHNIDAVEVFKPNIENFNLRERYRNVYNIDIKDFLYDYYDIIIFGDIIEHLLPKEAQRVLGYAYNRCKEMIVAVPYLSKQGVEENNIYEIHKQDDLTPEVMKKRYPYLDLIWCNKKYGYYKKGEIMKNYIVKSILVFDDIEEKTRRNIGDEFECTKERYEYLKEHKAVELVGIKEEEKKPEIKETKVDKEPYYLKEKPRTAKIKKTK